MYMFGLGKGWLSKRAGTIARRHGAELVNHTDAQCNCGYGCDPHECQKSRRHWFESENRGEPFNSDTATAVKAALEAAGILEPSCS